MESNEALEQFKVADRLYREGQYLEALETLDRMEDSFPNTKSIMFARARCYFKLNRAEEAIALCDEIIDHFQYDKAESLKRRIMVAHGIEESAVDMEITQTFGPLKMQSDSQSDF